MGLFLSFQYCVFFRSFWMLPADTTDSPKSFWMLPAEHQVEFEFRECGDHERRVVMEEIDGCQQTSWPC